MFRVRLCAAWILLPMLCLQCFAKDMTLPNHQTHPFVLDSPHGVSFWSDYRGPQFEGYASIGKGEALLFWENKLKKHSSVGLDSTSYKDLKQLWKAFSRHSQLLEGTESSNVGESVRDFEHILEVGDLEAGKQISKDAQNLADAYSDFRTASEQSPQQRTTEYLEDCRLRLTNLVGESTVRDLEESWISKEKSRR